MHLNKRTHIPAFQKHQSIKPKLYSFENKIKPRLESAKFNSTKQDRTHRSVTLDTAKTLSPNKDLAWRPKIPSKKLFEDPRFMQSIQRKKTKVLDRLNETNITISESQLPKHSQKPFTHRSRSVPLRQRRISDLSSQKYIHNDIGNFQSMKKRPLINHNLQYLLKQKKKQKKERQLMKNQIQTQTISQSHKQFICPIQFDNDQDNFLTQLPPHHEQKRFCFTQGMKRPDLIKTIQNNYRFSQSRMRKRKI